MRMSLDNPLVDKTEEDPQVKMSRTATNTISVLLVIPLLLFSMVLFPDLGILGYLAPLILLLVLCSFIISRAYTILNVYMVTLSLWIVLTTVLISLHGDEYGSAQDVFSQKFNVPEESITSIPEKQQDKQVYYQISGEKGALRFATFTDDKVQYEYYSFEIETTPGSNPSGYLNPREYEIKNITPITEKEAFYQELYSPTGLG